MAWDEITFKVSADMDFGKAANQLDTIKQSLSDMKTSISEMPNVTEILNKSFDKTVTITDELASNLSRMQDENLPETKKAEAEKRATTNLRELNALRDIQFSETDYSTKLAKAWFGNLPKSVQHQFDVMAPQLANLIRTKLSALSKYGNGISASTPGELARVMTGGANPAKMDTGLKRLVQQYRLDSESTYQLDNFIKYLAPAVSPVNRFNYYQKARYGSTLPSKKAGLYSGNPEDLFPESYKATFRSQGSTFNNFDRAYQTMVLDSAYRAKLNGTLANNPIAVKAAISSGIGKRDDRGVLEVRDEITRSQWENFRKALYDDLIVRVSGYKGNELDAYKATGKDKRTLMSRLTSSSSGQAMLAMQDIEAMENPAAWVNAAGVDTWRKLSQEGKRIQNQHVVDKYSLFSPNNGLQFVNPRKVMISESHNTRLLGNNQWRNNQDVSDTISIVSLEGYDSKNPEHKKVLENLFSEQGQKIGGSTYIAQSIHGTGKDATIRMIEKSAYDRINAQERKWIDTHPDAAVRGIQGSYWKGFDDAEIQRLIDSDKITSKDWGKHLEMQNKAWTGTSEVGINIDGKRFAVVNTRGFGDGGAWFSSSVMPHSGQFRGGLGLKGSAFVFEGNSMKALGGKAGLLDAEGRMMMEGPDGKLYDVSGYDGIIPLDVIKNKGILKDENGNFVSGDVASRRMTAMLQRYPMAYHVDYDIENKNSGHLGTQMASFMMLSPNVRKHQIEMAMKVMDELDTESGQLKHVFSDQNDYLSRKVNENTALLATDEAKARVDAKRVSLLNKLISAQYTDFEDDSLIANLRAVSNPVAAILSVEEKRVQEEQAKNPNYQSDSGFNSGSVIAKARYYLNKDAEEQRKLNPDYVAPQYSDQEIRDMIILPKDAVVDFNRKDAERVSIARSPTGFGNLYNARNLASLPGVEAVYKGLGVSTTAGIYVSDQNLDQLQSMDFDADQVKAIYDKDIADSIAEAFKTMEYRKEEVRSKGIEFTPEELKSRAIQSRSLAERNLAAPLGMGTGSSGIRIMQIDYSKPENQYLVKAARRMAGIYDIASTPKSGEEYEIDKDDPVWKALNLGKEYTKFSEGKDAVFKFDDDMLDEQGNHLRNHPDYFRASNGTEVNLRALRDMKLDEINLPSRYMANHLMGIADVGLLYRHGQVDTTQMDAIYEALGKIGYGDAGDATKALMEKMRLMHIQFGTGERGYIANSEIAPLQDLIDAANAEIQLSAGKAYDAASGTFIKDGKQYYTRDQFIEAQKKKYGVRTAENAIGQFGMVEKDLVNALGQDFYNEFANTTDTIRREEEDRAIILEQRSKAADVNLSKARNAAEQEKGSKRPKKTVEQKLLDKELALSRKALEIRNDSQIDDLLETYERALSADEAALSVMEDIGGDTGQINALKESITQNQSKIESIKKHKGLLDKKANLEKSPAQLALEQAEQEKEQVQKDIESNNKLIDLRLEFQGVMSDAAEFNRTLYSYRKGKENKIDDKSTEATKYWNRGYAQQNEQVKVLDALAQKIEDSDYDEKTKTSMTTQLASLKHSIQDNFIMDFADKAVLSAKELSESVIKDLDKQTSPPSKQKQKLNDIDKAIEDVKGYATLMQEKMTSGKMLDQSEIKAYEESINQVNEFISTTESTKTQLINEYIKQNEQSAAAEMESLQGKLGLRDKNSLEVQLQNRKDLIQERKDAITKQHSEGLMSNQFYQEQMALLNQYSANVDTDVIRANRLSLGLDKETPADKANKWLQQRQEVISFQKQQQFRLARDAYVDAERDPQSTYQERARLEKELLEAERNLSQETAEEKQLKQQAERMTVSGREYEEARRISQDNAFARQSEAAALQQEQQYERYRQQRNMRGVRSRLVQYYNQDELHRAELENQQRYYQDNIAKEQDHINELKTQLIGDEEHDKPINDQIDKANKSIQEYTNRMQRAKDEASQFGSSQNALNATLTTAQEKFAQVAHYLGRMLFQAARKETVRFVKEFDASMNEIQAITLKSDQEMESIRSQTIDKALGLRTSVSNVSNVEAALYRQGLSDQEVSARTESIIKFATVTKLNVQEATKIITTALQNDLVGSANEAMDALVALGDSAATTAAEIGKGMQKAAASAKVAGVSYAELTALLTIGTSDTQLSGTQVGTALQTVFTRMRRLSLTGWTADQNGEKATASDAEAALRAVGIDLYDDKSVGKMRSAYDVMRDLSKVWQTLSDAQKSIVTNSLAGTRQTNIFSTLMEGMSEDGGETLDKYLGLAEGSEGITQSKYDIAMKSLSASLDELRSSWDAVVESFTASGTITGALDMVSGLLQGIAGISEKGGGIGIVLSAVAAGIAAIGVSVSGIAAGPAGILLQLISALAAFGVGATITAGLTGLFSSETDEERLNRVSQERLNTANRANSLISGNVNSRQNLIDEVSKLGKAYDELKTSGTDAEQAIASSKLMNSLNSLKSVFPELANTITGATDDLNKWKDAVDAANEANEQYANKGLMDQARNIAFARSGTSQQQYDNHVRNTVISDDDADELEFTLAYLAGDFGWSNKYLDEKGHFSFDLFTKNGTKEEKAKLLIEALNDTSAFDKQSNEFLQTLLQPNSGVLENWKQNREYSKLSGNEAKYYSDAFDDVIRQLTDTQENFDESTANTQVATDEVRSGVEAYAGIITQIATEGFSAEDIQEMLIREIISKLYENGEENPDFFNDDGLITTAIDDYVLAFLGDAITNKKDAFSNLFRRNKKLSEYAYHVGDKGFDNEDDAIQYALANGYEVSDVKNKSNISAVQTTDSLLSAKLQETRSNNRQILLDDILNGYGEVSGFRSMTEKERRNVVQALDPRAQPGSHDFQDTYNRLLSGKQIKPLSEFGTLGEAKAAYDQQGLSSQLALAVQNNATAMAGWLLDDIDMVSSALNEELTGVSTPTSQAASVSNLINVLARNPSNIGAYKTDFKDSYDQLSSYFGAENLTEIMSAMQNGTYFGSDWETFVNHTVAEKGLKQGTGLTQYLNTELADYANQALTGGYASLADAASQLGWDRDLYNAVNGAYGSLSGYMLMSEDQKESEQGKNIKRDLDLQISVAGVQDLENANKILEGTTSLLQAIQKGGQIELKAKLDFEQGFYKTQQLAASLTNGTTEEQIQAIMSLTGQDRAQVTNNFEASKRIALSLLDYDTGAETLNALRRQGQEAYAAQLAEQYGYISTGHYMSVDDALKEMNDRYGYTGKSYELQYDKNNDELYFINAVGDKQTANKAATDWFKKETGGYIKTDTNGVPVRENLFFGKQRSLSAQELYEAQAAIRNGELSNTQGDYDKYTAAAGAMGQFNQDYMAMLEENKRKDEELLKGRYASHADYEEALAKINKYTEEELEAARERAENESAYTKKKKEEQDKLLELEQNIINTQSAREYADYNFQLSNRSALVAQTAWESRANYTDIASFIANAETNENWTELAKTEEYRKWEDAYLNADRSGLKDNVTYDQAMQAFASLTMYSHGAGYTSPQELARQAQAALTSKDRINNPNAEALRTVIGDAYYARWLNNENISGNAYVRQRISNYQRGLSGLTSEQRLKGIEDIIRQDTFYGLAGYDREAAKDYLANWSNAEEYLDLASRESFSAKETERLEELRLELQNLRKETKIQIDVDGIRALEDAGKVAAGTAAEIEKLKKGGLIALEVLLQYRTEAFQSGQQSAQLLNGTVAEQDAAAMAILGMSREQYYSNRNANYASAVSVNKQKQALDAETWLTKYNEANSSAQAREIAEDARTAGFVLRDDYGRRRFKYVGTELANVNPLTGMAQTYTDIEKSRALNAILNGQMERIVGDNGNSDLYDAAISSAGIYTEELLRRRVNNESVPDWLETASNDELARQRADFVSSYSSSVMQSQRAQYALNNYNSDNAGLLATFLNVSEEDISRMWDNGNGKEKLQAEIRKRQEAIMSSMAQQYGFDFDPSNLDQVKDNIQKAMENTSDEFEKMFLQFLAGIVDGGEGLFSADNGKSFAERYSDNVDKLTTDTYEYSAYKFIRDNASAARDIANNQGISFANALESNEFNKSAWNSEWNDAVSSNLGLTAAMMLYGSGRIGDNEFNAFMNNQMAGTGKDHSYFDMIAKAGLGDVYENGRFNGEGIAKAIDEMRENPATAGFYDELISKFPQLEHVAKIGSQAVEDLNDQWNADAIADAARYAKGINGISDAMIGLAKGGTSATKAKFNIKAELTNLQDQQTAINLARGKSGKELQNAKQNNNDQTLDILSSLVPGYDAEQLANMSAEELDKIIDEVQPFINDSFADTIQSLFNEIPQIDADVNLADIVTVNPDGSIDLSNVEGVLDDTAQKLLKLIIQLAGEYANVDIAALLNGDEIKVEAFVDLLRQHGVVSGNNYSRSSKKSGGSKGKSATEKAIEKANYALLEPQHNVKMAQIREKYFEDTNQYQNEVDAVRDEVAAQKALRAAHRQNIKDLTDQRNSVGKYTEDWWKLTKEIYASQEAVEELGNTLKELEDKRIQIVERKQANEDIDQNFRRSILDTYVSRYQMLYQSGNNISQSAAFDKYINEKGAHRNIIQETIAQNNSQIEEWEDLLKAQEDDEKAYTTTLQKILAIKEENAQLENQALQDEIDINEARLARINEVLQNSLATPVHELALSQAQQGIAEIDKNFNDLRTELENQSGEYTEERKYYEQALNSARATMNGSLEYSPEWYAARSQVYSYEEAIANLDLEGRRNRDAIEQSYLDEYQYRKGLFDTEHENILASIQESARDAQLHNDYSAYANAIRDEAEELGAQQGGRREQLAYLENLRDSGAISEGSDKWYQLLDAIAKLTNDITKADNDILQKQAEIVDTIIKANEEIAKQDKQNLDYQRALTSYYKESGNTEAYLGSLNDERNLIGISLENQQDALDKLIELRDSGEIEKGTKAYEDLLDRIQEAETEIERVKTEELSKQTEIVSAIIEDINRTTERNQRAFAAIQERTRGYKLSGETDKYIRSLEEEQRSLFEQAGDEQSGLETLYSERENWIGDRSGTAWDKLIKEIEDTERNIEKLTNDQLAKQQEIVSAYVNEVNENRKNDTNALSQLQAEAEKARLENNNGLYLDLIGQQENNLVSQLANRTKDRESLLALLDSGVIDKGSEAWKTLTDQIAALDKEITGLDADIIKKQQELVNAYMEGINKTREENSRRLAAIQEETRASKLSGNNDAYIQSLMAEADFYRKQREDEQTALSSLEALRDSGRIKDNVALEELLKNIADAELKVQQATNNAIEKQSGIVSATVDKISERRQNESLNDAILQAETRRRKSMGDTEGYLASLGNEVSSFYDKLAGRREDLQILEELRDSGKIDDASEAWEELTKNIQQTRAEIANIDSDSISKQQELIDAIYEAYVTTPSEENQRRLSALQERTRKAQLENDKAEYANALEAEAAAINEDFISKQQGLDALQVLLNSGQITEGSEAWEDLTTKISNLGTELDKISNDAAQKLKDVAAARLDKIVSDYENASSAIQHSLNIVTERGTMYQSAGELTNYGKALEQENYLQNQLYNEQINTLESLRTELLRYGEGSEEYENVAKKIREVEEEVEKTDSTIKELSKTIEENKEAIRKTKTDIENMLDDEIKRRIQTDRDMLSSRVNLQNQLLEAIRKEKQNEWEIYRKDIDEQKKHLSDEKNLLNERLSARKAAIDEEDRYEKLAEYQKQLAIVAADPTRTKDAKELRRQIAELQKEISWEIVAKEAENASKVIDERIEALDQAAQVEEGRLNDLLKDANAFADIINSVMSNSYDTYLNYMREHSESYRYATAEARQEMEQGWEDTWKKMKDQTDVYWDDIDTIMQSKDSFLDYMKESSAYLNASETGRESLLYQWSQQYDSYTNAMRSTVTVDDLMNIDFKVTVNNPAAIANALIESMSIGGTHYSSGGLVDYTGPAWVDGSKTRPEAFLDPEDTVNIRSMLDAFKYIKIAPGQVPSADYFTDNSSTIGDINVTIQQAELKKDADYEEVAKRVGIAFTKQLQKEGLNLTRYGM